MVITLLHHTRDSDSKLTRKRTLAVGVAAVLAACVFAVAFTQLFLLPAPVTRAGTSGYGPPPPGGYFSLVPGDVWRDLPSDAECAARIHRSVWEPRPDNFGPNHTAPDVAAVHASLGARLKATQGSADPRWDSWLLPRVDGQFTGTTDEIFQWAACKWGLPDDLLRGMAVRESGWYQYETYPSGRPVEKYGSGDVMPAATPETTAYCNELARFGHDYQNDYGSGVCPKTFGITGVMAWQAPRWGTMPGNQNGTFPFARDSTAFAVDYVAGQLRGCVQGWELWLSHSGGYRSGDLWGCVGAWYAGQWHTDAADSYIARVRAEIDRHTWLQPDWPDLRPSCVADRGCPVAGIR